MEYTRADETQMVTLVVLRSIYRRDPRRERERKKPIKYTQVSGYRMQTNVPYINAI